MALRLESKVPSPPGAPTEAKDLERLHVYAASLDGPTAYCLIDADEALGSRGLGKARSAGGVSVDFKQMNLQMGSQRLPTSVKSGKAKRLGSARRAGSRMPS